MAVDTKDQSREPRTVIPPIGCLSLQPWLNTQSHFGFEANQSAILETKDSNDEGKGIYSSSWQLLPDSMLVWMRMKAMNHGSPALFFPSSGRKYHLILNTKKFLDILKTSGDLGS